MTSMPHLPLMAWDHADRLQATAQQVVGAGLPETTWYTYDGTGQRARWVTLRSAGPGREPTRKCERIYVGGFEVYREYDGTETVVTLERLSLSVLDGTKRVALAERRTIGADRSPELLVRYQFGNHLGSASLELDDGGRVLSYEEYHPYGSTSYQAVDPALRAARKRYRFTGMERDESTGLQYHSARYYAPWLARWTACDPIGVAGGVNLYRYAANRPTMATDRAGLAPIEGRVSGIYGHHYIPYSVFDGKDLSQAVYDFFAGAASGYTTDFHTSQGSHSVYTGEVQRIWDAYFASNGITGRTMTVKQAEQLLELVMTEPSSSTVGHFLDQLHAENSTMGRPIGDPNVPNPAARPGTAKVQDIAARNTLLDRADASASTKKVLTFDSNKVLVKPKTGALTDFPSVLQAAEDAGKITQGRQAAARAAAFGAKGVKTLVTDPALMLNVEVALSDHFFADDRDRQHQIMAETIGRQDVPEADTQFMYNQFGQYPIRDDNGYVQGWGFDRTTLRGWAEMTKGIIRVLGGDRSDAISYEEVYPPGEA